MNPFNLPHFYKNRFGNISNQCRLIKLRLAQVTTDKFGLSLKLLTLTVIAAVILEHSRLDIFISRLFYDHGVWLIQKGQQPYAFIFYYLPKLLLISMGVYLAIILAITHRQATPYSDKTYHGKLFTLLPRQEMIYLLMVLITVPSSVALLKMVTHVSCPNQLAIFGGNLPYLNLWQDMIAQAPSQCFPAAHASAGFSLYGLVFLPTLHQYRYKIFALITLLGWVMGLYKMLFGDHFFSHTVVSMSLSLTLAALLACVLLKPTKRL